MSTRTLATSASFVTAESAAAALRSCGHAATVELHRTAQGPRWHVVTPAPAPAVRLGRLGRSDLPTNRGKAP